MTPSRDLGVVTHHLPNILGDKKQDNGVCLPLLWLKLSNIFLSDIDSPKNLVTDQVTENTLSVSWDPVQANIDRYIVSYTSADGETREVPVSKEKSSTVLTGLRPGMEYKVHVWAQKGTQESRKANTKAPTGDGACITSMALLSL